MPQQIIITVQPGGATEVKAEGYKGSGCKAFTEAFEKALGKTVSDVKTPEFTQAAVQQAQAKMGAR